MSLHLQFNIGSEVYVKLKLVDSVAASTVQHRKRGLIEAKACR